MRARSQRVCRLVVLCGIALVAGAARAGAQQQAAPPKPKKSRAGETIVIRGQVPTPQVVTVRPREVPPYSRQALGAANERGGGSFWSSALPGYQLLSRSQVTGHAVIDSATARSMAAGGPGVPGAAGAAGAAAGATPDLQARTQEMEAIRGELAQRRARLDSLERADRNAAALQHAADSTSTAAARSRTSVADAAARAAEIQELMKELEFRKARLDSLETVVRALGKAQDSLRARPDSTPQHH
jgi:hypothetical protein